MDEEIKERHFSEAHVRGVWSLPLDLELDEILQIVELIEE